MENIFYLPFQRNSRKYANTLVFVSNFLEEISVFPPEVRGVHLHSLPDFRNISKGKTHENANLIHTHTHVLLYESTFCTHT